MKITLDSSCSELLKTLDVLGMPAFIVDHSYTILACNDTVPAFFEYDRTDIIGRKLDRFITFDAFFRDQDLSRSLHSLDAVREGSAPASLRTYCFRKNHRPSESHIAIIPNRDQQPDQMTVIVRDAHHQADSTDLTQPSRSSVRQFGPAPVDLSTELSSIINSSLSIGTIFRMVVSELRKVIQYNRASLLLYNEQDDNLSIFALDTEMKTALKKGAIAPLAGTSAGWVVRNNKPWISQDLNATSFPLDRRLLQEGIRSTISIPLFHNRMLGVFNFDSSDPARYSDRDLEILLPVAKHISVALENALLFEEISKDKKEWERTFDAITDLVWIEDSKQKVIRANNAVLAWTGLTKAGITGKRCVDFIEHLDTSLHNGLCSETLISKRPSFRELKSTGGGIYHFWAYPLFDEEGKLYAIVHYLKDLTAQKRLEQQLIRSDKLASLGTLVAGIAHEVNNPLGIIAGYSEALLDRSRDPALAGITGFSDFPEYLNTIHSEIFRCKSILKSLLEFARPSGGTFREIDINELIKEVLLLLQHRTSKLKHTIVLDLTREVSKIYADAGSLRQLMINLLLNAIYFTPEGGSIFIRTEQDDPARGNARIACQDRVRLSVSDTGSGIPPDLINKVFDPFFTTKPVGEGTGLGLTICHKIVEQHGGTIDVESKPGEGTAFIITLPSVTCHD